MAKVKETKSAKNFIKALNALEEERGISKQTVLDALSEEEAQEIDPKYHVGDDVVTEVSPDVFGRLAAIQTKQILRQKIREAEKEALYNEYVDKKDDIITGIVDRVEERFAIINIGKTGALLPVKAQIPGEKLTEGQHLKVYVSAVDKNTKGTHIAVSRTEPGLVKRLFEAEVPEIYDGTVEIKSVAREAGERSKIAVYTANPEIDIVEWNEDPVVFISNALSPAKVSHVKLNKEDNSALVVVPDDQLSLAIGKKGQNARLAVHLTNWKIDIKSQSEVAEEGIDLSDNDDQDDLLAMMAGEGNDESFDSDESFDTDESFDDNESFDDEDDGVKIDIEALREANEEKDTDYVKVISEDDDEESEEKPDYDPKYDEDIDYDEYDKYYD